jgi:hypothetical protein
MYREMPSEKDTGVNSDGCKNSRQSNNPKLIFLQLLSLGLLDH